MNEYLAKAGVLEQLTSQDIPELDLYMDQVIQLFTTCYQQQHPDDKGMTKTMINNYAKGKLFPRTKNKKYNKTQIMLMNFIYQLKGTLSLTEIKQLLAPINEALSNDEAATDDFYTFYEAITTLTAQQHESFLLYLAEQNELKQKTTNLEDDYQVKLAQVIMLAHMSNLSRTLAQQLITELDGRS
ncbi:MAG: DUF1836 domain-containing protein [Culicoidibacterales bacterium]